MWTMTTVAVAFAAALAAAPAASAYEPTTAILKQLSGDTIIKKPRVPDQSSGAGRGTKPPFVEPAQRA